MNEFYIPAIRSDQHRPLWSAQSEKLILKHKDVVENITMQNFVIFRQQSDNLSNEKDNNLSSDESDDISNTTIHERDAIRELADDIFENKCPGHMLKYLKTLKVKKELRRMIQGLVDKLKSYEPEIYDEYNIYEALSRKEIYDLFMFCIYLEPRYSDDAYCRDKKQVKLIYDKLIDIANVNQ